MSRPCSNETEDPGCWIVAFLILSVVGFILYHQFIIKGK